MSMIGVQNLFGISENMDIFELSVGYAMNSRPRVPLGAANSLARSGREIQVNFCRMPDCDNYGVPALTTPVKPRRSPGRDPHYKISTSGKGRLSALVCKCCKETPPLKSNQGIAEELDRISASLLGPDRGCTRKDCDSHGRSTENHPDLYYKWGTNKRTGRPALKCKSCGTYILIDMAPPLLPHLNKYRGFLT